METQIDWQVIIWIGGIFLMIITGLLSIIAFLMRSDKLQTRETLMVHDTWIRNQQKEIYELTTYTKTAIEHNTTALNYIGQMQEDNRKRLGIFEQELKNIKRKRR